MSEYKDFEAFKAAVITEYKKDIAFLMFLADL